MLITLIFQDGKSNYLEGAMLIGMYTIIALAFVGTLPSRVEPLLTTL